MKKMISLVMCLMMLLCLVPTTAMAVKPLLTVGGAEFNGTTWSLGSCPAGVTATYASETGLRLILENANVETIEINNDLGHNNIPATIVLKGTNTITGRLACGCEYSGLIIIGENGSSLTIEYSGVFERGVLNTNSWLTVSNTTLTINSNNMVGLGVTTALLIDNSTVTINNSGTVSGTDYPCAISLSEKSATFTNSTITANSTNGYGIFAYDDSRPFVVSIDENTEATISGGVCAVAVRGASASISVAFAGGSAKASTNPDGTDAVTFDPNNLATYKYISNKGSQQNTPATSSVSYGGGYTLYKTISSDLASISKVYVDGKEVDAKYYTVWGSNVTLNEAFLKTLSAGEHSIKLTNDTLQATGTFKLEASELTAAGVTTSAVGSPKTADAGVLLYTGLAISSVLGMGYMKKKEH